MVLPHRTAISVHPFRLVHTARAHNHCQESSELIFGPLRKSEEK